MWAVLVPESLAYATIAGVPPVVGLYAAVPGPGPLRVIGSSRHLVVSPMSATAALSIGVVATVSSDPDDFVALTTGLALATGLVAIAAGLLRLGFLASFISEPVLKGFIIGLALTILIGQLPALVGVDKGSGNFFEKAWDLLTHLDETDALTVGRRRRAASSLLLALRRLVPLLPASLVVALAGIAVVALFGLDDHGLEVIGHIDSGLPDLGLPDLSGCQFIDLLGGAVGVMLVGFAEGLGAAKTYAAKEGYDIDANRELLGLGAANLGAGLASGMVVNGSLSKTAVNGSAGARSQLSGLTAAVLTVVTLLFLTGLFEKLPEATLAAIVIAAVIELVDIASLRRLWRVGSGRLASVYPVTSRADFVAAAAALLGVLLFDTLPGLVIGIAVSLVLLIARTSRPHIASLAPVGDAADRPWIDIDRNAGLPHGPGRARRPGRGAAALRERRLRPHAGPRPGRRRAGPAARGPRRTLDAVDRRHRLGDARPAARRPAPHGRRARPGRQHRAGPRRPRHGRARGRTTPVPDHRGRSRVGATSLSAGRGSGHRRVILVHRERVSSPNANHRRGSPQR